MLKNRKGRAILNFLIILALVLTLNVGAFAQGEDLTPTPLSPLSVYNADSDAKGERAAAPRGIDPDDLEVASIIVTFDESFNGDQLAAFGQVIHRYQKVFNGASLVLPGGNVDQVASLNGVTAVYLDTLLHLDTEISPGFIGAPVLWDQLGGQQSAGEGVIVGVLDSGVWPEHPSYSDPDPFGNNYPAPPVMPGSNGFGAGGPRSTCDFGNTAWNPNDAPFTCNNKLIGAYDFTDTYKAIIGLLPEEFSSARDADGHGTHTSSTAAGNGGVASSIFGVPRGTISGVAPRAHVIMYKVCNDQGCFTSDSAAAIEQAILDEVDAVNFSISGGGSPYSDIVSLAFLAAYENGLFVAASAGNGGPGPDTVAHREPWTMTVGASTSNRHFISTVSLMADNGDTLTLEGASVTGGISTPTDVVLASDFGDGMCNSPFPAGTFSGEIVICQRGVIARVAKSFNVAEGGAGGMLLYNPVLQGLATDNHFIPSVHLENDSGDALLDFMATHAGVMATFTQGVATTVQGDKMAAFSSRGGPGQTLGISKPDITAPGVQILAGHTPLPATVVGGLPGELFQSIQGTSMSSPHMAGSAALMKDLHPDWTPGQIKSALMTTAKTDDVFKEDGVTPADPFDYGSGRVDLSQAGSALLTFDETAANYVALEDELWNANYPSLYVPVMPGQVSVRRTVHNESNQTRVWQLSAHAPSDVQITVPRTVRLRGNGNATFWVEIDARNVPLGEVRHAMVEFNLVGSQSQTHHFPITIVRRQPVVTLDKVCEPASIPRHSTTECIITAENTAFSDATVSISDRLPSQLKLIQGSVIGGTPQGNRVTFNGSLFGAAAPIVMVVDGTGTSPAGYLPLSIFGIPPISGVGDETIVNLGVPGFLYAGETYTSIGMVSNGYGVVGGGTSADVEFMNQVLPDPAPPNNVLAPFWTDLNPGAGGDLRAALLTDGVNTWIILDWENVQNFSDGLPNSFQIWIGVNGVEDISFTYGDVTAGDGGFLTVGAENAFGSSGENWYVDGSGTPVAAGSEVRVTSVPGAPGETHIISFDAVGLGKTGPWTNCAEMTTDLTFGTSIACFSGEVTP